MPRTAAAAAASAEPEPKTDTLCPCEDRYPLDLRGLLPRLRPFQRNAVLFATGGGCEKCRRGGTTPGAVGDGCGKNEPVGEMRPRKGKTNGYIQGTATPGTKHRDGRILLADEMGLGKTVTSLAIMMNYMDEWPLLILCPASLRYTWPGEIEKFFPSLPPRSIYVVSGFDDADFYSDPTKRSRIKIVVATYSLLQTRSASARVLDEFQFRCVIADESHNLKEKNSQRCKLALPLLKRARRLVLVSGTPALARPVELWAQLHCIDEKTFGTYTHFTKRYCNARRGPFGWDVKGISNADELHGLIRPIMVRRLKADVLTELPAKQRSIVPMKIEKRRIGECRALMKNMKEKRQSINELLEDDDAYGAHFEARRLLMDAYQASGIAKASSVADLVVDWLVGAGTQKLLVFAHHKEVLNVVEAAMSKKFKGMGHIRIDGSVSPSERAHRVRKFQNDARVRLALLSMTAAGVGITLTAASTVIFAELHWTPGVLAQAEDRCHRIGQSNAVNILYCVCKDEEVSLDMTLWHMLGKKVGNVGRLIDGDKGASMNATDSEIPDGEFSTSCSGEDELATFFAENSSSNHVGSDEGVPVKGTIESFFFKKSLASSTKHNTPRASIGQASANYSNIDRTKAKLDSTRAPCSVRPITHKASSAEILPVEIKETVTMRRIAVTSSPKVGKSWTCGTCTYINTHKSLTDWLACEMCGSQMIDDIQSSSELNFEKRARTASVTKAPVSTSKKVTPSHRVDDRLAESVIELCSDSESEDSQSNEAIDLTQGANPAESNDLSIIEIGTDTSDDEDDSAGHGGENTSSQPLSQAVDHSKQVGLFSFCVSKNSGRISIHLARTGESLKTNFDLNEVVRESETDCAGEVRARRSLGNNLSKTKSSSSLEFIPEATTKIFESMNARNLNHSGISDEIESFQDELNKFVTEYCSLREVEKKVLKELAEPVTSSTLRQTVAKAMTSSTTDYCFDRYVGGAKERAEENIRNDTASQLDHNVVNGLSCAWCAKYLLNPYKANAGEIEATYCSHKCAEEGRLRRGGMYASSRIRSQLFCLEKGICKKCGIDAHALFLRIKALDPAERLSALCNANWKLPKSGPSLERILHRPNEGDFWQADHILAVAEGGGDCGLENFQTLCTPCHKNETERLRGRLRLSGGAAVASDSSKRGQKDIRLAFSQATSHKFKKRKSAD